MSGDATCPGPNVSDFSLGPNEQVAQSFAAGLTGDLVRAELPMDHITTYDGECFLRGASLVDGHPAEQVLATARIDDQNLPGGQSVVGFALDPLGRVTAGTSYALVLSRAEDGEYTWQGPSTNRALVEPSSPVE